ncbi:pantetheine-phosphate adenylyltransferase [Georgenia sp. AZ-5]|uniref:pantetheine-phosphate adenylyltransferase n=1 Tax=Georgenia sp. AZ-5 TaxID=3367526 RepID=UPI0037540BB6
MSLAVCPGSYDPITLGHVDVVRRARAMFDEVVVAVAHNPAKRYLFSPERRVELAREALAGVDGVRVALVPGLLARYCADVGAAAIVKGLRGAADFDAEQSMALMNRHLAGIETVFVMGDPGLGHVASSLVKDVVSHGGQVDDLVPPAVAAALREVFTPTAEPAGDDR